MVSKKVWRCAPCRCPKVRHSLSARHSVISLPARRVRSARRGSACWQDFEVVPKRRTLARKEFSKPRNGKTLRARRLRRSIEKSALRARHLRSRGFSKVLRARLFGRARFETPCHEGNFDARVRSGLAGKEIRFYGRVRAAFVIVKADVLILRNAPVASLGMTAKGGERRATKWPRN
jgi:hypothetical protein